MILTGEEPRLGSWPELCLELTGQAGDALVTCPHFLPHSSSMTVPWGAEPWDTVPFLGSLQSPGPALTRPKSRTLNGTGSNCSGVGRGCPSPDGTAE